MKKTVLSFVLVFICIIMYSQVEVGLSGNVGIGREPEYSYQLSVTNTTHFDDVQIDGSLGIGDTPSSTYPFYVKGASKFWGNVLFYQNTNTITFEHNYSDIIIDNSGFYGRAIRPQSANYNNCGTSTYYWHQVCSGEYWTYPSDVRLKENIKDVTEGLSVVMQLRPVTYDIKREVYSDEAGIDLAAIDQDRKNRIGFLAQELQLSIPNAVKHNTSNDTYGVNFDNIIPVLVKAIQEQQEIINKQGEMISKLSDRIKDL